MLTTDWWIDFLFILPGDGSEGLREVAFRCEAGGGERRRGPRPLSPGAIAPLSTGVDGAMMKCALREADLKSPPLQANNGQHSLTLLKAFLRFARWALILSGGSSDSSMTGQSRRVVGSQGAG